MRAAHGAPGYLCAAFLVATACDPESRRALIEPLTKCTSEGSYLRWSLPVRVVLAISLFILMHATLKERHLTDRTQAATVLAWLALVGGALGTVLVLIAQEQHAESSTLLAQLAATAAASLTLIRDCWASTTIPASTSRMTGPQATSAAVGADQNPSQETTNGATSGVQHKAGESTRCGGSSAVANEPADDSVSVREIVFLLGTTLVAVVAYDERFPSAADAAEASVSVAVRLAATLVALAVQIPIAALIEHREYTTWWVAVGVSTPLVFALVRWLRVGAAQWKELAKELHRIDASRPAPVDAPALAAVGECVRMTEFEIANLRYRAQCHSTQPPAQRTKSVPQFKDARTIHRGRPGSKTQPRSTLTQRDNASPDDVTWRDGPIDL